jgi:hypothetical protein
MTINDSGFPKLDVKPKTGNEVFEFNGRQLTFTLMDFWRWSASDLVSNAARGILAEYIVASALGLGAAGKIRSEWDAYDLLTADGIKIEVKSAAYLQSWYHKKLSAISFGIRPTTGWNDATNERGGDLKRQSDVYVFCVLHHQDKETLDPLNLDQWTFYILPSAILDEKCPIQKSIGLKSLLKLNPGIARYDEIADCIAKLSLNPDPAR